MQWRLEIHKEIIYSPVERGCYDHCKRGQLSWRFKICWRGGGNKTTIVLHKSEGKEWKVYRISPKGYRALCGGWKQFLSDYKLNKGHVCVFQLVNTNELKVSFSMIIRNLC
ncbi:hypothetical protein AABB24_002409 [Solanum stoloniferum]|uniref:TF-B3 domain-containing protein n=1 Tax=Solanum stoloniferum TaxID=62892 RepID=A0ABD2VPH2_9SOLN